VNANTRIVNDAWQDINQRRYDTGAAMHTWARIVSNAYGVVAEMLRPPGLTPAWLLVPISLKNINQYQGVPVDGVIEGEQLSATRFEPFGGGSAIEHVVQGSPQVVGTSIEFQLNKATVATLKAGTSYLGFIVRKGAGAAPPLVVVVLQVNP
jgi:hypothetical protein